MRDALYAIGAAVVVIVIGLLVWDATRVASNLPPRIECKDRADALAQAGPGAIPVLGTGSMAPYIRAAAPSSIVAYVILEPAGTFDLITPGDLCIYRPSWHTGPVIHQAVLRDDAGWIMSGLGNPRSEPSWRVTASNFDGIVARTYVWP